MTISRQTLRVVLLAYDDMNLLDLCGPLQALATASKRHPGDGPALYETLVASADGGLITTSAGLPVATVSIATLDGVAIDTLIVPGGCKGQEFNASPALVNWIARRAPLVRRLCSVCTGAFLLAAAGQLEGRRAATHWEWVDRLRERHPGVDVDADKIFVKDGSIWTSAGVSAGIDLTLALIEEDYGHQIAIETARQLVVFMKRTGGQSQFSVPLAAQSHEGGRFDALHAWVAAHLRETLTVERLAEQAGMSARTFARTYAAQLGRTPAKMVEAMRLEAACRALEKTALPLKAIAANTGYVEEQNLRRVFQRQLGVSPGQYRDRFSACAV
ncbi:GlxA family transcriptional regulator [Oxalobacteraceae bacterium OTU3CINTB1]|nr:GlxA family transcriptional regulator [Oxalobacteraceae bacterium OTU3CINTB1]